MLDMLRRNAGSWFIKFILSFIALTFIIWGVGNYGAKDPNVVAVVGKETISMNEFAEAVANRERSYREAYGAAFTPEIAQLLDIKKQTINLLVRRKILLLEAEKMGLRVTDDEVQREIASTPAFQANGKFQSELYRQILAQNRLNPSQFESATRTEIILRRFEDVLTTGAFVPESEAKHLFFLSARKIRILVVTADPAKMKNLPAPTEEEITAKFEQVKEFFRVPSRVKLAVAVFTPDRFSREVHPSEEELKAYYEGNTDNYRTEEQRLVSRIVLPYTSQNKAQLWQQAVQVASEMEKGKAAFEAAAKKLGVSKTPEAWVTQKDAVPVLANALFQAPVDTIVGPADQGGAYVLAYVSRIKFSETLPFAQVRDRVLEQLQIEKGKDIATIKVYEAQPKAVESNNVSKTAAAYGIKTVETGWVGEEGSLEVPAQVTRDALMLVSGEIGPIKTLGDRHYLYQVIAKEDSRILPLDQVRPQILALVTKDQQAAAARAAVQKVLSEAKTAAELEANAKKAGLSTEISGWFAPLAENLPANLAQAEDIRKSLALLSPKSPLSSKGHAMPGGSNIAVAFLEEQPASEADWIAQKDAFSQMLRQQEQKNLIERFLADRVKQYKVEIKQEDLK